MKMSKEKDFCAVCDHEIVPGVACDGHVSECPRDSEQLNERQKMFDYGCVVD